MRFLARRLGHGLLVLIGVSLLSFGFMQMAPGQFFSDMRLNPQLSPQTLAALRGRYGLDRPLPVRYVRWLSSATRGDLGFSFAYNLPAAPLLWQRARNTLALTISAAFLSWLIAIPLGAWIASRRGSWADRLLGGSTSTVLAIPDLLLGLGLLVLALKTRAFAAGGMVSLDFDRLDRAAQLRDVIAHFTLPVTALVLGSLPILLRHIRSSVAEALDSPFIHAARANGIPPRRILFGYALRAAANPLISLFGLSISTLLSASLLIEVIMSWPGLGPMLLEAILARDLYLVIGAVMFSAFFMIAGSLIADVLLYLADPRIRTEAA